MNLWNIMYRKWPSSQHALSGLNLSHCVHSGHKLLCFVADGLAVNKNEPDGFISLEKTGNYWKNIENAIIMMNVREKAREREKLGSGGEWSKEW